MSDKNDFEELGEKIRKARGEDPNAVKEEDGEKKGMRAGSEFLAAVIGFGALGFFIDKYFDTTPWAMMILFIVGFVGGVYTANKTMGQ